MSLCCWFMRISSTEKSSSSQCSTELWKSSQRLSLKDILHCGDGLEMLQERLFLAELCRISSLSLSSPLWRIQSWSSAFRQITKFFNLMTQIFPNPSPSSRVMGGLIPSLLLGLSLLRLCLRTTSLADKDPHLFQSLFPKLCIPSDNLLDEFDQLWNHLKSHNLIFVFNSYLIELLYHQPCSPSPSSILLEIMKSTISHISFVEYPRYLLLLDWLLEKKIFHLTTSPAHIQPHQSKDMLLQVLSLLEPMGTGPREELFPYTLTPLAQVSESP